MGILYLVSDLLLPTEIRKPNQAHPLGGTLGLMKDAAPAAELREAL
jgi:hypothetical protein